MQDETVQDETVPIVSETFNNRSMELPDGLLRGAIEPHVHPGPALKSNPGRVDPIQAAEQAKAAGMRAIVLYDQTFGNSTGTAWVVSRAVKGIDVFGGLMLTSCQGGLNPRAVKTALYYGNGAKYISFGAHCTYYSASTEGRLVNGKLVPLKDLYPEFVKEELSRAIRIPLDDPIQPELEEILQLVADHPHVYLNTGHVSGPEVMRVLELAERFGIRKVYVAHMARKHLTLEQEREAARRGAFLEGCLADWFYPNAPRTHYYIEREYMDESYDESAGVANVGLAEWRNRIRAVGPEHYVLGTDYGIRAGSTPVEAMRTLIASLLDIEFTTDEIRTMTSLNPARLLDLDQLVPASSS